MIRRQGARSPRKADLPGDKKTQKKKNTRVQKDTLQRTTEKI